MAHETSPARAALAGGALTRQPLKGLAFLALAIPFGVALWLVLRGPFGLSYTAGGIVFTVCFTWFWQIGWAFGGWPGDRITSSRPLRGLINWLILMALVWATLAVWSWFYDAPFAETGVGLWGQTTIIAGVISLFFFGNQLLLSEEDSQRQPLGGLTNVVWAVLFLPTALYFLPQLVGAAPAYLPWIWFPIALVVMSYFGGRPFDDLGQPRAGIAYTGAVLAGTVVFIAVMNKAGINFFGSGDEALRGAVFGATWTNVGLAFAWLFNMWPIGKLAQPLKGVLGTVGTLAVAVAIYAGLIAAFPNSLEALVFGSFAFMWAQVSLAGIGLWNVYELGHEEDPLGAGPEPARRAEPVTGSHPATGGAEL